MASEYEEKLEIAARINKAAGEGLVVILVSGRAMGASPWLDGPKIRTYLHGLYATGRIGSFRDLQDLLADLKLLSLNP